MAYMHTSETREELPSHLAAKYGSTYVRTTLHSGPSLRKCMDVLPGGNLHIVRIVLVFVCVVLVYAYFCFDFTFLKPMHNKLWIVEDKSP